MKDRKLTIDESVLTFPRPFRRYLQYMVSAGGRLKANLLEALLTESGIPIENLMLKLLPLAKSFAEAPVSGLLIGAVALAENQGRQELFLGANVEFAGVYLNQTIHAEQTAIINAWHRGASHLETLAVSAPPCGHCRQFLLESNGDGAFDILLPADTSKGYESLKLKALLPRAFGPRDLGQKSGLLAVHPEPRETYLDTASRDPLVRTALEAAAGAYSPYSGNQAGCCLETTAGTIYFGCSAENAAFNPGVTALQSAWIRFCLDYNEANPAITRAILVEIPTLTSQKTTSEVLLAALAPAVRLEYHVASSKP